MGVANGLLLGNVRRVDDGVTLIERGVVVTILTECEADLLLPLCITVEVGKEIVFHREFDGKLDGKLTCCTGRTLGNGSGEYHLLLLVGILLQQFTVRIKVIGSI